MTENFKVWAKGDGELNDTTKTRHGGLDKDGIPVYVDKELCGRAVSMERLVRHGDNGYLFDVVFDLNGGWDRFLSRNSENVITNMGVKCDAVGSARGLHPLRLYLISEE